MPLKTIANQRDCNLFYTGFLTENRIKNTRIICLMIFREHISTVIRYLFKMKILISNIITTYI